MGRPSDFTQEAATVICDALMEGRSLRTICLADDDLPSERTVYRWLEVNDAFRQQYAHAREVQADTKFDQVWDIADKATAENVQVARLQIDAIKWQAGKLAPKKYGEKVELEHSGSMAILTPEQRQAEIDRLVAKRNAAE